MRKFALVILSLFIIASFIACDTEEVTPETPSTVPPSIMVDGELYTTTGEEILVEPDKSVINEQTIEKKLNNITNPKSNEVTLSSNPYDYIESEKEDYEYIVSQGEKSLNYMLNKFENSNSNGLQEYIMAIACSEILEEDTASKNWTNGRQWYENYSEANK